MTRTAAVIGGGIFGLTAAIELATRGHAVTLYDTAIPHPLAESTDISKVVRVDYGADLEYVELGERALAGWRRWNSEAPLFHETGVTFLARSKMQPGTFEYESYHTLTGRGHPLVRLDAAAIAARFPAYRPGALVDGYWNPLGGWAAASDVVRFLAARARSQGVDIRASRITALPDADLVVVCAGAWTAALVPELAPVLQANGQPVFHLRPDEPVLFAAERFPVFGADISQTGYYGFPVADGVVKIANHGTGIPIARDEDRVTTPDQEAALRAFLADTFPALAAAPIVHRRLCVYSDTRDGQFWIARHPTRENLVVATGGSGHAFKFAPILGALIADAAEGNGHPKFRWRTDITDLSRGDAARH